MKFKNILPFIYIACGVFFGFMVGVSMDPVDRAIRTAQKINRTGLKGVKSLRPGGAWNLFGILKKEPPLQEKIQTDPNFSNQYVQRIEQTIDQKEKAIETLDEIKDFVDLATQEVFIDNSLQKYLFSLGRIQLENGMVFQAITNLQRSYDINPYDSTTAQLLSFSYLRVYQVLPEGSEKNAVGDKTVYFLKLTLKSKPNSVQTMYGLALMYTDQGLYTRALPLYLDIIKREPENIEALLGVARIYYDQGELDRARRLYEQTEALILELKSRRSFVRQSLNVSALDQKLRVIRQNLEIIYRDQGPLGNP